jgi:hypothetical protein
MKIKSILNEIDSILPQKNKALIVESRASHVITSASNIMNMISENYDTDTAEKLQKKFLNAIRTGNVDKFSNALKRINNEG